ncbi:hypothetical protein FWG86_02750 [Candidatus Saccharibacteria bacterium]|nr:hypothetical protein [Candidatus Saccharibacteria bacterium]
MDAFKKELNKILSSESTLSHKAYCIIEILGPNYNFEGIYEKDLRVQEILELASDIEINNFTSVSELEQMYSEIERITASLA